MPQVLLEKQQEELEKIKAKFGAANEVRREEEREWGREEEEGEGERGEGWH